jgi:hypothetical protein
MTMAVRGRLRPQPDHVVDPLLQLRIAPELEELEPLALQGMASPRAMQRSARHAARRAPVPASISASGGD